MRTDLKRLASVGLAVALLPTAAAAAHAKPRAAKCVVPNIVNQTLAQAQAKLRRAHCVAGVIHAPLDANGRPTVVLRESPKPGRRLSHNARISIWLIVKPTPAVSIGGTQTVYDIDGNPLAASVLSVIDPATPADQYLTPDAGKRFVAVDLHLADASSETVASDANNNVSIIGTDDQAYTPDFNDVAECTNFDYGSYTLSAGQTEDGCVVFQLPVGVNVQQVQFTLGNGVVDFNA